MKPSPRRKTKPFWISATVLGAFSAAPLVLFSTVDATAEPLARNKIDAREVEMMQKDQPEAIQLLEKGEAAMRAGRLEEAANTLDAARRVAPARALPARRRCQVLEALGQADEAQRMCAYAMSNVGSELDIRANVGALLTNPGIRTPAELNMIAQLASRAQRSDSPWGAAAECDIARRLGNRSMLKGCVNELSQIAPNHYETLGARRAAEAAGRPWVRWLARSVLALLFLGTLLRRGLVKWKTRSGLATRKIATGALLFVAYAAYPSNASAESVAPTSDRSSAASGEDDPNQRPLGQLSKKFPVDLDNPKASMPSVERRNRDPVQFGYWLMDLSVLADNALKKEDWPHAAKYFEAIIAAVPDRALGYSRLCRAYLGMNDRDNALMACGRALGHEGATVEDHQRFAELTMSKEGNLAPAEIAAIDQQVKHLVDEKQEAAAYRIACELAARLDDRKRLEACTAGLEKAAPNDLKTVSFEWALALKQGDTPRAEQLIDRAAELGMTEDGIQRMQDGTKKMRPLWRSALSNWRYVLGGLLFAFAGAVVFLTWRQTGGARAQS